MKQIVSFLYQLGVVFSVLVVLQSCAAKSTSFRTLNADFESSAVPTPPDYANLFYWTSHPDKEDTGDHVPGNSKWQANQGAQAVADVFFIHPTSFTKEPRDEFKWNGNLQDEGLNKETDDYAILYQASVFNAAGKVYAPRYRQAHISAYFVSNKVTAKQAFELAYSDVKKAFQYYLKVNNNGRPIIIASHSQGSTHAIRLLKEFFDGKPLADQLVTGYLVGMPVPKDTYQELKPCKNANDLGCINSWRTYRKGTYPNGHKASLGLIATNPLSWTTGIERVRRKENQGGILLDVEKIKPKFSEAQLHEGLLWVGKPRFFGNFLLGMKDFHVMDYNLFWEDVRGNAVNRVQLYQKRQERAQD